MSPIHIELAKPVAKKLKILLYGPSGSKKTLTALEFPRVLLVDSEAGTEMYRGRPDIPDFHVADCKTLTDLEDAVKAFEADRNKTWDTFVVDSITVFHAVEKTITSANNTRDIDMRGWNRINGRMNSLYNRLTGLNGHVIIIAREATEYAGEGLNLKKVGVKPDADKNLVYAMDFVIHMNPDHSGTVEKSRGVLVTKNGVLPTVSWSTFADIAAPFANGEQRSHESDEAAAERELDNLANEDVRKEFTEAWVKQGLTHGNILTALAVTRLGEWPHGRAAADKKVKEWHEAQLSEKPAAPKGYSAGVPASS